MLACSTLCRGNAHVQRRPTHGSGSQLGGSSVPPSGGHQISANHLVAGSAGVRWEPACRCLLYEGQKKHHAYIFDVKDRPRYPRFGGDLRRKMDGPQSVRPDVSFGRCRKRSKQAPCRCKSGPEVVLNPQHFPSVLRHSPRCLQSALRALLLSKPSRLAALGISHEPGNDKR